MLKGPGSNPGGITVLVIIIFIATVAVETHYLKD